MKYLNYYLSSKNYANRSKSSRPNILRYTLKQKIPAKQSWNPIQNNQRPYNNTQRWH